MEVYYIEKVFVFSERKDMPSSSIKQGEQKVTA
jgi:hypothetical protein